KRSGPFGYVIKPVDNRELRTAVEMALYRHHMEIRLKREKEKAEAADRAKTEFLANISHELKTPMNGILGLTDLVLESALPETQLQLLEMVKASGLSLLAVINDILEFSMLHSDKVVLNNVPFELREILKMSVQAFRAEAQRKDIHLELRISPHVPPMVYGDPARLRQVLFSLVGNAVKFTEKGKVHVEVLAPPASDLHKNNSIVFKISDTGIGIPENKLEAIFNSFTQADGSFTRQHGGAGLGLAICYRLVKLMDGEILVESKEGNGSTFSFNAHFAYEHNGKIHENTDS
ncbi:MAG: hypothetical protein GY765_12735, partial [bacterium]|nr:hypothetical protein [bacterium]